MANYIFTCESFGADCPANWEEIADALNALAEGRGIDDADKAGMLWDEYCTRGIEGVPDPVFE